MPVYQRYLGELYLADWFSKGVVVKVGSDGVTNNARVEANKIVSSKRTIELLL